MPEQASQRGDTVTQARFTGPFDQHLLRFGQRGLNLKASLDALEGWSRLTNVVHTNNGELTARPGQTVLATGGSAYRSVRRLWDPEVATETRLWIIDAALYRGASGALTQIDSGYSGAPATLLPHRPTLSGDPWMFVADRQRMRKVRADGLVLPIGLPAPGSVAVPAHASHLTTGIATFDTTDSTEAAQWTPTAGTDASGAPSGAPIATDELGLSGSAVEFTLDPGGASGGYDSWFGMAAARNLNTLQGGAQPATDDDLIHFWVQLDKPDILEEFRLYLVVSPTFDPVVLPGTEPDGLSNSAGYVKAIRKSDFANYLQAKDSQINVAEGAILNKIRDEELESQRTPPRSLAEAQARQQRDQSRTISQQAGGAAREWVRFGYFEIPLRRGDFQRFGTSAMAGEPDWGAVTGLVIYIRTVNGESLKVRLDDWFLHGGFGIDSTEPGAQPYDWRYTHYDPRTGAESNPSETMDVLTFLDVDRKECNVQPAAHGDGAIRQRFYRRGGSLIDDWYFCGTNAGDGGTFLDQMSDAAIAAAGTLQIDHYQPVPTVDANGNTVLAQAIPSLWGPVEGMLMGCGDPYRPGHVYFSLAGQPDHWSAFGNVEVCPPSEELLSGGVMGTQAYVWSRAMLYLLYPALTAVATVTASPTLCRKAPIGRWAQVPGPGGIYFVAEDGIYRTTGGPEERLSDLIEPLFHALAPGQTSINGLLPIDLPATATFTSLTIWEHQLFFLYQDTGGARQVLVYDLLEQLWRHLNFGRAPNVLQGEDEVDLLMGSLNLGQGYTHTGVSDAGLAIACNVRPGSFSGGAREEKLYGDAFLDADRQGVDIAVQMLLNEELVANTAQTLIDGTARTRYILDAFGNSAQGPQRAHSVSTDLSWSSALFRPILYQLGYAITPQPDITNRRVTNWDDLGHPDENWVTGLTLDVDTGNAAKTFLVERDFNGVISTVGEFTVQANGRHKIKFSWDALPCNMVRIRPESEACQFWLLYRADWIWVPEPPRISKWDIHFENSWDSYYTGLDLYCDTGGQEKQIEVSVDEQVLTNQFTLLPYFPVTANGRRVIHLTLPWGRGHVFRFRALDDFPGLLYKHRWHLAEEPSEQANWNSPFTILGTRSDKYLKAVLYEVDTFGQNKSVQVEADGAVVETQVVNTNGRRVVQIALSPQRLGRVFRFFPVDGNPSRLYSLQPVFDEEPFQLTRWETQETNHNLPGFFAPLDMQLTLKSSTEVLVTVILHHNQNGGVTTKTYKVPTTKGVKRRLFVPFAPVKGVLVKYILTCPQAFHLYREETLVRIKPWGLPESRFERPFGSDDLDPTRPMTNAALAAETNGGSLGR